MRIKTYGSSLHGINAITNTIEVNISQDIRFIIVGFRPFRSPHHTIYDVWCGKMQGNYLLKKMVMCWAESHGSPGGNSPIQHANPEKEESSTIELISKKYKFDIY